MMPSVASWLEPDMVGLAKVNGLSAIAIEGGRQLAAKLA